MALLRATALLRGARPPMRRTPPRGTPDAAAQAQTRAMAAQRDASQWRDTKAWVGGGGGAEGTARVFGAWADAYDKHRPGYPDAVFVATDSDRDMLDQCAKAADAMGIANRVETAATSAEHLSAVVADGSASVLTVFQAFHWLDARAAMASFARALAPNGTLALVWNDRDLSVPWVADLESAIEAANPEYHRDLKQNLQWEERLLEASPPGAFAVESVVSFPHSVEYHDPAHGLKELLLTYSYVQAMENADSFATRASASAASSGSGPSGVLAHPYLARLYLLRRL